MHGSLRIFFLLLLRFFFSTFFTRFSVSCDEGVNREEKSKVDPGVCSATYCPCRTPFRQGGSQGGERRVGDDS